MGMNELERTKVKGELLGNVPYSGDGKVEVIKQCIRLMTDEQLVALAEFVRKMSKS